MKTAFTRSVLRIAFLPVVFSCVNNWGKPVCTSLTLCNLKKPWKSAYPLKCAFANWHSHSAAVVWIWIWVWVVGGGLFRTVSVLTAAIVAKRIHHRLICLILFDKFAYQLKTRFQLRVQLWKYYSSKTCSPPRLRLWFIKLHVNERSRVHKLRTTAVENWSATGQEGRGGCSKVWKGLEGTIFGIFIADLVCLVN